MLTVVVPGPEKRLGEFDRFSVRAEVRGTGVRRADPVLIAVVAGIEEIQRGIMDFVKDYKNHFQKYPFMFNISGRDAYAPMLVAASNGEQYLKTIENQFRLEANIV